MVKVPLVHLWWTPHNGLMNVTGRPELHLEQLDNVEEVTINYEALVDEKFIPRGSTGVNNPTVDKLFKEFQQKALKILQTQGGRYS
jgi:hypothetical protein